MKKGILTVISGFSGVGKGTVVHSLLSRYEGYTLSVSITTRQPRVNEINGKDYFFISEAQAKELVQNDALIEHTIYCGNYYGTPRAFVEEKLQQGLNVILEIEVEGAKNIRRQYPDSPLIFIMPPDAKTLIDRLTHRGTECHEVIASRLSRAAEEAESVVEYDYVFVNEDLHADECADRIHSLIQSLSARTSLNEDFVHQVCDDILQRCSKPLLYS